jgi:hypothetical protein
MYIKKISPYGVGLISSLFYIYFSLLEENKLKLLDVQNLKNVDEKENISKFKSLYYSSYLGIVPTLFCYYNNKKILFFTHLMTTFTSINYWRNPKYSWRRTLDVHTTRLTVLYNIYNALFVYYPSLHYTYIPVMSLCCLSYPYGIYNYSNKKYLNFINIHLLCQILGCTSTVILSFSKPK